MLDGFDSLSSLDLSQSEDFLRELDIIIGKSHMGASRLLRNNGEESGEGFHCKRAIDCGAGVGRVTAGLLVHHFDEV